MGPLGGLLGLVLSAIVAGTDVDIAEVSYMYMSDFPSPQPLDIEYGSLDENWQSETDKRDALQPAFRFEVTQIVFIQISLRITNDGSIDYTFCLSTGL